MRALARLLTDLPPQATPHPSNGEKTLSTITRSAALLAVLAAAACAPVAEPIIAPLPRGAALDSAPRPFVRPVEVPEEFRRALAADTRSEGGEPGGRYWQQRVRYTIQATLDPGERRVTGSQRIVYHNRSPDTLDQVVFNLYQNLFTRDFVGPANPLNTGGYTLTRFEAEGTTLAAVTQQQYEADQRAGRTTSGYLVTGTLARAFLPRTVATGDSIVFEIDWSFRVPPAGAPRTGWEDALGGRVFTVAQWYPQVATYDDVSGWNVTPYREQGEFYLEYGDFDVSITLPAGYTVGATGELANAGQVLRPEILQRLGQAEASDTAIAILPASELRRGPTQAQDGQVTWRFTAADVRDFAWAASNRYVWEAARARVPAEAPGAARLVTVHSLYRNGAPHWGESVRMGRHALEHMSRAFPPYVYPQLTIAEGPVYGMEYPMLVFIGRPLQRLELYEVIAHEIAHQWFPMMVGQDEAAYAWMDEGFATFMEARAVADYFPDTDPWEIPRAAYLSIAGNREEAPLMRHIDLVFGEAFGVAAYFKPGVLMRSLERVLGPEVFERAMREYVREWTFRHPTPWDFFNTVERVSGRELDWFFYPWFFRTVTFDQEIGGVEAAPGVVRVTVRDVGQIPGPTDVVVTTSAGPVVREIPIERWLDPGTRSVTVEIPVTGAVTRVELDPLQLFPDANRRNNVWTP